MGFYSFVAISRHPVTFVDPLILLGRGTNTFTAVTDDVDGLVERLADEGVDVRSVNRLDALEAVPIAEGLLLPGEVPDALLSLPEGPTDE